MFRHAISKLFLPGLIVVCLVSSAALAGDEQYPGNRFVNVRLASESDALTPGVTSHIAAVFEITKDWHLYWRNPGDSGLPPQVKFNAPSKVKIGEPLWPLPSRVIENGLVSYVFEHQLVLIFPVTLSTDFSEKQLTIDATIDWLVCREKCVQGLAKTSISLPVSAASKSSASADLIRRTLNQIPRPAGNPLPYKAVWKGPELTIQAPGAAKLAFYPYNNEEDAYPEWSESQQKAKDILHLQFPSHVNKLHEIRGLLLMDQEGQKSAYEINVPIKENTTAERFGGESNSGSGKSTSP